MRNYTMFWLTWIGWAVMFAVLFSVVKALDRLNHSVELIDARLDHLSGRLTEVLASAGAGANARMEEGRPPHDGLLERAADQRSARELERSAGR